MGVKDESSCRKVFNLIGPKGGVCVGFFLKPPENIPPFDVIHLCVQNKEDIEKSRINGKCFVRAMHSFTAEEAMKLGASLIQAAGFYKASKGEPWKGGFYSEKWE